MSDNNTSNTFLFTLILLSTTMFIWTLNYISEATSTAQVQTVISAFGA